MVVENPCTSPSGQIHILVQPAQIVLHADGMMWNSDFEAVENMKVADRKQAMCVCIPGGCSMVNKRR